MNPRPHGIPEESGSGSDKRRSIFSRKNIAKVRKNNGEGKRSKKN